MLADDEPDEPDPDEPDPDELELSPPDGFSDVDDFSPEDVSAPDEADPLGPFLPDSRLSVR